MKNVSFISIGDLLAQALKRLTQSKQADLAAAASKKDLKSIPNSATEAAR